MSLIILTALAFADEPTAPVQPTGLTDKQILACQAESRRFLAGVRSYGDCLRDTAAAEVEVIRTKASGQNQSVVANATAGSITAGNTVMVSQTSNGQTVTSAKPGTYSVTYDEYGRMVVHAENTSPGYIGASGYPARGRGVYAGMYDMPMQGGATPGAFPVMNEEKQWDAIRRAQDTADYSADVAESIYPTSGR